MARIRSVKPEFWSDRSIARVSRDARLLYISLWNQADEHGRLHGDPRWVKGHCLPYEDDLDLADIDRLLDELENLGKVRRYVHDGDPYLYLPNLKKHQRLESAKVPSRLPEPPEPDDDPSVRRADKSARDSDIHSGPKSDIGTFPQATPDAQNGADKSVRNSDESAPIRAQQVAGCREHVAGSSSNTREHTPPLPHELPEPVRRLRGKLQEANLNVRWDRLTVDQIAEIVELIEAQTVERLVRAAVQAYQPNDPPAFAQAWLGHWRSLPPVGERLRAVRETCPVHALEKPCRGCAADKLAGEA